MRFNELTKSGLVKSALLAVAVTFSGAIAADSNKAPLQLAALSDGFNAEQVYMASCFACHNSGAGGAPMPADKAAWASRMEKGMDAVMTVVINGLNAMPAKGLCFTCTDDDLRAVAQYMYDLSQK